MFVNDIFEQSDGDKCFPVNVQGKLINCLMYADDLLILSENKQGLSESLQILGKYTEKWNLKISERKTKMMIFNKSGKTIRLNIEVNGILINSCTEYTYLDTVFIPGNTFKKNQIMLFKKACRALFGFLREINPALGANPQSYLNYSTLSCHQYCYAMRKYGGGGVLKRTKLTSFETFSINLFDDTSKHEILQVKMAKIALTVHKNRVTWLFGEN